MTAAARRRRDRRRRRLGRGHVAAGGARVRARGRVPARPSAPVRGPGLVALVPLVDRMVRVDLRTVTLTVPPQEVITRDNVPARVAAVCYFRIVDAVGAVTQIEAFAPATSQIAQTTLRSVLGGADLDQLLAERESLNEQLQRIIDEQTEPWGIKVSLVEIKDVEIPEAMQRAMARQAEAERERRAKIIAAEGEFQAAEKLAAAAAVLAREPASLQLRYLQTLTEIGGGQQGATIVFPLPVDLVRPFLERRERSRPAAPPRPDVDVHPLPAHRRARVLRRRPAAAGGRGHPGRPRPRDRDAPCRGPLRGRQRGRASRPDRHRRRDGVAFRALG